jgi:hypothetical protein
MVAVFVHGLEGELRVHKDAASLKAQNGNEITTKTFREERSYTATVFVASHSCLQKEDAVCCGPAIKE